VEKLEDNILDTILKIPKVVKQAKYVEDVSKKAQTFGRCNLCKTNNL